MKIELTLKQRTQLVREGVAALCMGQGELAAKGFTAAARGVWEGSERDRKRNRPGPQLNSVDNEMDMGTREAMASEARALTQTFGVFKRIMRAYSGYTVGSCLMKWNTGNPEIDRAYRKYWREFMPMADANGIHHFQKLTRIAVAGTIRDGRAFGQKVTDFGMGQVRLIESDRVNTNGSSVNVDEEKRDNKGALISRCVGGIELDAQGRRTAARIWERQRFGAFVNGKTVPWREMFCMFDTDRVDDVCGVTAFHTALNAARDYKETKVSEMLANKRLSKWAIFIKTALGGAGAATGITLYPNQTPTQTGETKTNVQEVNDVTDVYGSPTDSLQSPSTDRPSQGWRWLMEDMIREIAIGLDLPFGVVWNMSGLGGPAARFEINQAARTFRIFIEDVLEPKWLVPIVGWKIAEGIAKGQIPFHPNWSAIKPQRPVYITIDLGRDSKAGIEENKAALLTATSWFEEMGLDFEEETEILFQEQAFREQMAKKYGVDIDKVRIINPNIQPPQEPQQKAA